MSNSTYKYFLRDLGHLLKEAALDSKAELKAKQKSDEPESDVAFSNGKVLAYYEVISLMQQQAKAFNLHLSDLALNDIDAESDLL